MDSRNLQRAYSRARLDDRQVAELIGMARGITADDILNDAEIEMLYKWLVASEEASDNPVISGLCDRIEDALADGVIDDQERADLIGTLKQLCAADFQVGEALKASTLPLCTPPPAIRFEGERFCFTGTFVYGSRSDCEEAVAALGGSTGDLVKATRYLIVGEYATDAWAQSSWGRKIEKAMAWRDAGVPIHIVGEPHWRSHLR